MTQIALVKRIEVKNFIERLMRAVGSRNDEATELAKVLVHSDYRGHFSHGINRLEMYYRDVKTGSTASQGHPIILKEKGCTAWVDGNNLLGSTVSRYSMDLAINKAKEFGIGWVVAKGSNHFSIAGHWALQAEEH